MKNLIHRFVLYLSSQDIIKKEDEELYQYGLWSGFLYFVNTLISLLIIAMIGTVFYGILFLVLFIIYRSFAGGYHHKSPFVCFLLSQGSVGVCVYAIGIVSGWFTSENWIWMFVIYLVSSAVVIAFVPRQAPENPLSQNEIRRCRNIVTAVTALMACLSAVLAWRHHYMLLSVMLVLNTLLLVSYGAHFIKSIRTK